MKTEDLSEALSSDLRSEFSAFVTELLPEELAGWDKESDPLPGVTLWSRSVPSCALRQFKAEGLLDAPPSAVKDALWDGSNRMQWDSSYASAEDLIRFKHGDSDSIEIRLARLAIKRILTIAPRDFASLQALRTEKGSEAGAPTSYTCVAHSIVHDEAPEQSGFVRGTVLPGTGWRLEPVTQPDGVIATRLTYIIHTDLAGWIPAFVYNAAAGQTLAGYFKELRAWLPAHKGPSSSEAASS